MPASSTYGRTERNIRPVTTITCTPAARTAAMAALRARAQDGVLGDERAVEVEREGRERAGEAGGKLYGSVPPVDFTT